MLRINPFKKLYQLKVILKMLFQFFCIYFSCDQMAPRPNREHFAAQNNRASRFQRDVVLFRKLNDVLEEAKQVFTVMIGRPE